MTIGSILSAGIAYLTANAIQNRRKVKQSMKETLQQTNTNVDPIITPYKSHESELEKEYPSYYFREKKFNSEAIRIHGGMDEIIKKIDEHLLNSPQLEHLNIHQYFQGDQSDNIYTVTEDAITFRLLRLQVNNNVTSALNQILENL